MMKALLISLTSSVVFSAATGTSSIPERQRCSHLGHVPEEGLSMKSQKTNLRRTHSSLRQGLYPATQPAATLGGRSRNAQKPEEKSIHRTEHHENPALQSAVQLPAARSSSPSRPDAAQDELRAKQPASSSATSRAITKASTKLARLR